MYAQGHVRVAAASKCTCVHKCMLHVFELDCFMHGSVEVVMVGVKCF